MTDRSDPDAGDRRPTLRVVGPDEGAAVVAESSVATAPAEPGTEDRPAGAALQPAPDSAADGRVLSGPGERADSGRIDGGEGRDDAGPDACPRADVDAGRDDEGDGDGGDDEDGDDGDGDGDERDWAWVAEWRESNEPTPWATGLPLAAFAAVLAGVAIWVLSAGLADRPLLAVVLNLLVAGGLVPAMWLSRNLPVLRWFAAGSAVGVVGGWVAALMML
ncbi:DUF2537 domain-containing protein [Nakamurella sp.]|uniref:DUF2537 domain-containing protein n=1 Tax=Nakamurella sp. TaxID=1869182 RepID=UPI003B3BDBA3